LGAHRRQAGILKVGGNPRQVDVGQLGLAHAREGDRCRIPLRHPGAPLGFRRDCHT
jgi:hypothetical protein